MQITTAMDAKDLGLGLGLGSRLQSATLTNKNNKNHDDLDCRDLLEDPEYSEGEDSDSDDDYDDLVCNYAESCCFDESIDAVYKKIEDPTSKLKGCEGNKVLWERRKGQVLMEGFVEEPVQDEVKGSEDFMGSVKSFSRTKSLTDDDLDELKGCLDLGFGFNYEEIPELCNTLPALELCYSISQKFQDEQQKSPVSAMEGDKDRERDVGVTDACSANSSCTQSPIANWKISSPGDHPEEVKARLKFWAQAVACTIRLCS